MSSKPDGSRAPATTDLPESLVIDSGSYNGCSIASSNRNGEGLLAGVSEERRRQILARFWLKVNKTSDCWLWTASANRGYGQFMFRLDGRQRLVKAHRFSYELHHGVIPNGMSVLHACDTPRCLNPAHLFAGTQAENLDDARAKGRLIDGRQHIKVSDAGLLDIVTNYRPRHNGKQLAAKYGVSLISIMRIVAGTQRVQRPIFERVPSAQIPVRGEVA